MKIPKMFDKLQIIGFAISATISISLLIAGKEAFASITLGIVLAIVTQLFDLQIRHMESEERLLQAYALNQVLYRDKWLLEQIQQIVSDYLTVKGVWFGLIQNSRR